MYTSLKIAYTCFKIQHWNQKLIDYGLGIIMTKLLFSLDKKTAQEYYRLSKSNKIRRIRYGIYTDNFTDPVEVIVKKHWMEIIPHIVTTGILSFRTAFELKTQPYKNGMDIIFLTSTYTKTIKLPGLVIKIYKGNPFNYIEQVKPSLARSNTARMLLENLNIVKSSVLKGIKTIGPMGVEKYLARELQIRGEARINAIRDEARKIANDLHYQTEYAKLSKIVSALLSTHDAKLLKTDFAKAILKKVPYDEERVRLFEKLALYLQNCIFRERPYTFSTNSFRNLAFFESYFSNFIEGIEFLIDEAEDIIFRGVEIYHRHADSHDVLANFDLANDYTDISITPKTTTEFLALLKTRHAYLMKSRPEKIPGEFKEKPNKAGSTFFVDPKKVVGTLMKGFEIYQALKDGLQRALFMHFLISEVHPFNDGNGRLSRIMLNSELVKAGLYKIIVPTVCRDNYLGGLRRATRDQSFYIYCKVMDQLQAYTESVEWDDYGAAREKIESDNADKLPDEGLPIFNRALRNLRLSDLMHP